jgi:hypothetical protein
LATDYIALNLALGMSADPEPKASGNDVSTSQ